MASRSSVMRLAACLAIVVGCGLVTPQVASAAGKAPVPHTDGSAVPAKQVTVSTTVSVASSTKKASVMSAGYAHSCLVTSKGRAQCWGYNSNGQIGNGTTTNAPAPVTVPGLAKGVKSISPGYYSTCALTTKGGVKCWGYNAYGQLGDNSTTSSSIPVGVYGLGKGVKAISTGYLHACALTTKGGVKCWGSNNYGALGDNSTTDSPKPVGVYGLTRGVKAISTGYAHTCALTTKGKVLCWGGNGSGQLGDNTTTNSPKPVKVYGLGKGIASISTGYLTTCATTTKGKALCWGDNGYGQLGDGTTTNSAKPVMVSGLSKGVKATKPDVVHTCALTTSGAVKCWGYNSYGQLGDNSTTSSLTPVKVYNLDKSTKVSLGYIHTCALTARKAIKCWGNNSEGQLGDNSTTDAHAPVKVYGF